MKELTSNSGKTELTAKSVSCGLSPNLASNIKQIQMN